jgi:peroxiredoxin
MYQRSNFISHVVITMVLLVCSGLVSQAFGEKSTQLKKSGTAIIGQKMPFFAGWKIGSKFKGPTNSNKALQANKTGYVITLCAEWCKPCMKGLAKLAKHKEDFDKSNKQLIIIVADSNAKAQKIYNRFNLKWATFILDEFKNTVSKISPDGKGSKGISLPKTFVLNRQKKVTRIISKEGSDFIKLLFK